MNRRKVGKSRVRVKIQTHNKVRFGLFVLSVHGCTDLGFCQWMTNTLPPYIKYVYSFT